MKHKKTAGEKQQRTTRVFSDYPEINSAYSDVRRKVEIFLEDWNRDHPELEKFGATDLFIMAYFHYCIPQKLNPKPLGTDTAKVQNRLKDILYPILREEGNELTEKSYARIVSNEANLRIFLERLSASRTDNPSVIPYMIPGAKTTFKNLYDAKYLNIGTKLKLRAKVQDFHGIVDDGGKVEITLKGKRMTFDGPAQAAAKGIEYAGFNQWRHCYVIQADGGSKPLEDYRIRFEEEKPFPSHFDSVSSEKDRGLRQAAGAGTDDDFFEGSVRRIEAEIRNRSAAARKACIAHHGCDCAICGLNFESVYGLAAKGFIHVHHLELISEASGPREVDPIKDLIPLCPNCHSVVHLRKEAYTVDEVREMLCKNNRFVDANQND